VQRQVLFCEAAVGKTPTAMDLDEQQKEGNDKMEVGVKEGTENIAMEATVQQMQLRVEGQPEWRMLAAHGADVDMLLQHYRYDGWIRGWNSYMGC